MGTCECMLLLCLSQQFMFLLFKTSSEATEATEPVNTIYEVTYQVSFSQLNQCGFSSILIICQKSTFLEVHCSEGHLSIRPKILSSNVKQIKSQKDQKTEGQKSKRPKVKKSTYLSRSSYVPKTNCSKVHLSKRPKILSSNVKQIKSQKGQKTEGQKLKRPKVKKSTYLEVHLYQ